MILLLIVVLLAIPATASGNSAFQIARLKYEGGGDWYNDPSSEVNLLKFVSENTNINVNPEYIPVDIRTNDIFKYPFLFVTGHGSVVFTESQKTKLEMYLESGGFIYIDDDYGMDKFIRPLLNDLLPDANLETIPLTHPIFSSHFEFETGVPKVHEHDDKVPEVLGLYQNGRLCLLYTYESNPSDGWADADIHNNSPHLREQALKFGTNVIVYALTY